MSPVCARAATVVASFFLLSLTVAVLVLLDWGLTRQQKQQESSDSRNDEDDDDDDDGGDDIARAGLGCTLTKYKRDKNSCLRYAVRCARLWCLFFSVQERTEQTIQSKQQPAYLDFSLTFIPGRRRICKLPNGGARSNQRWMRTSQAIRQVTTRACVSMLALTVLYT